MSKLSWLTPDDEPVGTKSIVLIVPNHWVYEAIVRSALLDLINPDYWQQHGNQTVENAVDAMLATVYMSLIDWDNCE